ncbi:MAG: zinc ribbon domain-containing protein [Phycisphaerales bacterium]|nr:zinc ribbon domain-containing protein [Phycisphaerales bacterium]
MPSQREDRGDADNPQESDVERFGGETRPCPKCNADIYDEAEWCHKCGHVLSQADQKTPGWIFVTASVLITGFLFFLLFR